MIKHGVTPLETFPGQETKIKFLTGFTLIELLISAAIVSLVAIAVYSVFASGIRVWQQGSKSRSDERRARLVCEKLSRELRNSFKFSPVAFDGTESSIAFALLVESNSDAESPQYEVGRVSYFLNEENKLCRLQQTYPESLQEEEASEYKELLPGVLELNFSYCYLDNATGEYKWKEDWVPEEQDSLPRAVKIELVFKEESEQKTRPWQRPVSREEESKNYKFSKTIFMPIGTGEQKIVLE